MGDSEQSAADVSTSTETVFHIKKGQLPLHCPLPEMSLWNQHPRVFLPIEDLKNPLIILKLIKCQTKVALNPILDKL